MNKHKDKSRTKKRLPKGKARYIPSAAEVEARNAELNNKDNEESLSEYENDSCLHSHDDNSENETDNMKTKRKENIKKEKKNEKNDISDSSDEKEEK